jgi:hypothetical protein
MSASQIQVSNLWIVEERAAGPLSTCLAHGEHVATMAEREGGARVLLHEQDGDSAPIDFTDAVER